MDLIDGTIQLNIELKGSQTAVLTSELIEHYFETSTWEAKNVFHFFFRLE